MLRQMTLLAALASGFAAACTTNSPASIPVLAAPAPFTPKLTLVDELADDEHDGVKGYFITWLGMNALHADFERELGSLRRELARERVEHGIATDSFAALSKATKSLELRAQIGLPLGIGIGVSATLVVLGVLYGILKATLPMQLLQAAQR